MVCAHLALWARQRSTGPPEVLDHSRAGKPAAQILHRIASGQTTLRHSIEHASVGRMDEVRTMKCGFEQEALILTHHYVLIFTESTNFIYDIAAIHECAGRSPNSAREGDLRIGGHLGPIHRPPITTGFIHHPV